MRRLIQVYDKQVIRNFGAILALKFDEAIFIYDRFTDTSNLNEFKDLVARHSNLNLICLNSNGDLNLSAYHSKEDYYNLNGPDNFLNVKLSLYVERNFLNAFYLFTTDQKLINVRGCAKLEAESKKISLSVEDIINVTGAKVLKKNHTPPDISDQAFIRDIKNICQVMMMDFDKWTKFITRIAYIINKNGDKNGFNIAKKDFNKLDRNIIKSLIHFKIISLNDYYLKFKSSRLMKMFKSSGSWLEYLTYIELMESNYFDDVEMSTVIDFDGNLFETVDDRCEIDVICTSGLIPIFISNKIGKIHQEALYEIKSHSLMFGNQNGRAIICTGSEFSKERYGLYKKAMELDIYVIEYQDLINHNIAKIVNDVVHNRYQYRQNNRQKKPPLANVKHYDASKDKSHFVKKKKGKIRQLLKNK